MKKYSSLALTLVLICSQLFTTLAQQQRTEPQESDDDVVRITTNLVQIDAVVTDKEGRQVTDLRPEEFEIYESGRRQQITNFSYISVGSSAPAQAVTAATSSSPSKKSSGVEVSTPVLPARLRPEQARRTVVLVVDDLSLSFESTKFVQRALKKYVDEQMQPNDLVAIVRTSSGVGTLQQLTADRRQLGAAIERVRWSPRGRTSARAVEPRSDMNETAGSTATGVDAAKGGTSDDTLKENAALDTIAALNLVVRGLREIPGRKAVMLFTDSLQMASFGIQGLGSVVVRMRELVERANRASVVFYTMDSRGLQTLNFDASEGSFNPISRTSRMPHQTATIIRDRRQTFFEEQDGMNFLARETGGIFNKNSNDFNKGLQRMLDDQRGYYLVGYRPDESTFDKKTGQRRFHNLKINVKRGGVHVRSRNGFYGVADPEARPATERTAEQRLAAALTSPFAASEIDLRLTAVFNHTPSAGSFMSSLIYVDPRNLSFTEEADGWRKATLDIVAVIFDIDGRPVDQVNETREVRVSQDDYQRLIASGLTYMLNVPIRKAGSYQLRAAVRDASSERTGSATQYVEVPDLSKNQLAVSGITLQGVDQNAAGQAVGSVSQAATGKANGADPQAGPAVRRLRQGMVLEYGYIIYNAQQDRTTGKPNVTTQVRLFRDGKVVFTGRVSPLDISQQRDWKRLVAGGRLMVGTELAPGEYILQVIVTDLAAKEKRGTVTQWIDFEVLK
jgi:VWFA-related protein